MADRKRTNAEIDALNQFLNEGETALPYELEDVNNATAEVSENAPEAATIETELTEEQKTAEADKIAAQKIIDDSKGEIENLNADATSKIVSEKEKITEPAKEYELTDEAVLAYLKNKKGKEVSSLDEFINPKKELTEEEKSEAKEKRESNMFAYGLSNGRFTKKELDNFISDTKNPSEIVFTAYAADQKQKDESLTDEDIREEFNEKFGLDIEDKDSRHYIAGQNLINRIADGLIKQRYPKIVNLENDYSSFENTEKTNSETTAKYQSQAPVYKKDIEEIKSLTKKLSIPINDKETFEFVVEDTVLGEVMNEMLSDNVSKENISKGWTKDNLKQVAHLATIMKSLPKLLNDYANAKELAKQGGLRGIVPAGKEGTRTGIKAELTEDQKRAISLMDERLSLAN